MIQNKIAEDTVLIYIHTKARVYCYQIISHIKKGHIFFF